MRTQDLTPNPKNPRKITDAKLDMLKRAMLEFGDLSGIVFNRKSKQLVGGHQRTRWMDPNAEVTLTKKYSKPTKTGTVAEGYLELDGERYAYREVSWDKHREMAANIAANKGAGEWDMPELTSWIKELSSFDADDFDLSLTMFDEMELEDFGGIIVSEHTRTGKTGVDEDEVPEKPVSRTRPGYIYQLGEHRLMCGDSTDADQVGKLMNGKTAILMVTDPPYGVKLDQSWRDKALGSKAVGKGNKNVVANDDRADWFDVWALAPVQVAYVWHSSSFTDVVMDSLRRADFDVRQQIIWNKSVMVMGRSAYHFKHEPCWYAVKTGATAHWIGDRKQVTVWDAAPPNHIMGGSKEERTEHPTQKPVALYEIPILNHCGPEDAVYEPFSGSGSGFIACEKLGRKCFGMELNPHYCDVIVERWEKYTGQKAKLLNPNKMPAVTKLRKAPASQGKRRADAHA